MDDINRAIAVAQEQVSIVQTWFPTLEADIGQWQELARGVACRILLAGDPIVKARLKYRPHAIPLIGQNLALLSRFISENNASFEVRLYDGLPFGPVYIVDETVYWGIFLANRDSMMGPRFKTTRATAVGKMIIDSFESMWDAESSHVIDGKQVDKEGQPADPAPELSPLDLELVTTEGAHHQYRRYCSRCNTWLSYRTRGPSHAAEFESYCANPVCPSFNQKVESLHVS
jgi:hypothetical protein